MAPDDPERERRILANGWKGARDILDYLFSWDPPEALVRGRVVRGAVRAMLRDWLGTLEIFVRRLLFIMALRITPPAVRPRIHSARRTPPVFDPDNPAGWRVSLRIIRDRPETQVRSRPAGPREEKTEWDALPFARRLEALRRILAQPERRALSLARKLARIRTANRGRNAPRTFTIRQWLIPRSLQTEAQACIDQAMDVTELMARRALKHWEEPG